MNQTQRLYEIDQLLQARRTVSMAQLIEKLNVSHATVKRDLEYLRDRLNAPVVWDREQRGYKFDVPLAGARPYALPGIWFRPEEAEALLTMQSLLGSLQPEMLGEHLAPLKMRLNALIGHGGNDPGEVAKRIRVIHLGARRSDNKHFQVVASAVLSRKRLRILYYKRLKNVAYERDVSPQRLVFYRDNWYLDAWCHLKNDLRSFALDAMQSVALLNEKAKEISDEKLDGVLKSGYGLHSNKKVEWAKLKFTPERARWVSLERWHPKQRSRFEQDGSYILEVPFNNERDLLMDILKHGDQVEVLGPSSLIESIRKTLLQSLRKMS